MPDVMRIYGAWCGTWGGSGKAQDGRPVLVRMVVEPAVHGAALRMAFEATSPDGTQLYHGVVCCVGTGPTGAVKAATYSTIHGVILLDQTPDDERVLALAGDSEQGNRINVTIHEEAPDRLGFSAMWRPPGAAPGPEQRGRMTAALRRLVPMRVPPKQKGRA